MSLSCTSATPYPSSPDEELTKNSININTADIDALEALPGIGRALAAKIIEHRTRYGPFRKREHLLIVDGISEKKFRAVEKLISTD